MIMTIIKNDDLIAFHPGLYVKDLLDDLELSQKDLSKLLNMDFVSVNRL